MVLHFFLGKLLQTTKIFFQIYNLLKTWGIIIARINSQRIYPSRLNEGSEGARVKRSLFFKVRIKTSNLQNFSNVFVFRNYEGSDNVLNYMNEGEAVFIT